MTDSLSLRISRLTIAAAALACASAVGQATPLFTAPLPTGARLDPAGDAVDLGSLPINLVVAPDKDRAVVVLSGWREQGLQVVDLNTKQVTQTLLQDGAFYGAAFSPDGQRLCISGGNTDKLFVYRWKDGAATLENRIELANKSTADSTGTSYPAGLTFSGNGNFIYVAENVGDRLAVVNAATGEITQRFPTDHYPYGVVATADGQVFVSAWGGTTVSRFRVTPDGTLALLGRIEVGRHPSALAATGTSLYVTLAGSDRIAVIDTTRGRITRYLHDAAPNAPPEGSTPNAVATTRRWQAPAHRGTQRAARVELRPSHLGTAQRLHRLGITRLRWPTCATSCTRGSSTARPSARRGGGRPTTTGALPAQAAEAAGRASCGGRRRLARKEATITQPGRPSRVSVPRPSCGPSGAGKRGT